MLNLATLASVRWQKESDTARVLLQEPDNVANGCEAARLIGHDEKAGGGASRSCSPGGACPSDVDQLHCGSGAGGGSDDDGGNDRTALLGPNGAAAAQHTRADGSSGLWLPVRHKASRF
jgi:hypothetical protein